MNYKWSQFLTEGELNDVGIVVCLNDKQQFLIIRRSDMDSRAGQWTIPGGHIDDEDRSIEAGAVRELDEETNNAFGLCCLHEKELGYVNLDELLEFKGQLGLGIERDKFFGESFGVIKWKIFMVLLTRKRKNARKPVQNPAKNLP